MKHKREIPWVDALYIAPIESKSARSEMRAAEKAPFDRNTCPPCTGGCHQGRRCPAHMPAEAATEVGNEDLCEPPATRLGLLLCALSSALVVYGVTTVIRHFAG